MALFNITLLDTTPELAANSAISLSWGGRGAREASEDGRCPCYNDGGARLVGLTHTTTACRGICRSDGPMGKVEERSRRVSSLLPEQVR